MPSAPIPIIGPSPRRRPGPKFYAAANWAPACAGATSGVPQVENGAKK